jgi:hypothetical protein
LVDGHLMADISKQSLTLLDHSEMKENLPTHQFQLTVGIPLPKSLVNPNSSVIDELYSILTK